MAWIAAGMAIGAPIGALIFPWRGSPLRSCLLAHSNLYQRWIFWRFRRSMRLMERDCGEYLLPVLRATAASMAAYAEATLDELRARERLTTTDRSQ